MQTTLAHVSLPLSLTVLCLVPAAAAPEGVVSGELKAWHKVTLTLDGPAARERDTAPNPFLDYRLTVRFTHESGSPAYDVPGYFAADGNAGETSAEAGAKWRAHLSPDKAGRWTWRTSMARGPRVAVEPAAKGEPVAGVDGLGGSLRCPPHRQDRPRLPRPRAAAVRGRPLPPLRGHRRAVPQGRARLARDAPRLRRLRRHRGHEEGGPAQDVGAPPPRLAPGGPDVAGRPGQGPRRGPRTTSPSRDVNAFSFLTYNAGGDGDNVWPFVERDRSPLRLLEARPVAGGLRPRAAARPLPPLQDARRRRWTTSGSGGARSRETCPRRSTAARSASSGDSTTASWWPASATSSPSTGTSARKTPRRPRSSGRWRPPSASSTPTATPS